MKLLRKVGSTSQILQVFIQDSSKTDGSGLTGLSTSSGISAYYHRDTDTTATTISLVNMTVGTFTSSGFKEIDPTNMPGWYQLCPPNACFASGASSVGINLKGATNMAPLPIEIDLDGQVDVTLWNGAAVASPATAGVPEVNVKNINNISASSVSAVNANVGTTQPINFHGTSTTAYVKSDLIEIADAAVSTSTAQLGVNLVNIAGSAVSTNTAQLGVNVVNFGGSAGTFSSGKPAVTLAAADVSGNVAADVQTIKAQTVTCSAGVTVEPFIGTATAALVVDASGRVDIGKILGTASVGTAGYVGIDWSHINTPTTTVNLSGTTIDTTQVVASVSGAVGSVTGAVGSVTGNVGGNVTGSVGSVSGNIGGNVTGSVGSVVAAVAITSNIKKNQALSAFEFLMTDSTSHAPASGLTVSVERSIDGGAFGAGTLGTVSEIGNGIYAVDFGAGDLNGKVITLHATASGADDTYERVVTQP